MSETSAEVAYDAYRDGVTTSDASARVQRVPVPVASPGSCLLCGKSKHPEGFAFFGIDFEFYGTLYFCADCGGDIANCFGWMEPNRVSSILAEHDQVIKENVILGQQVEALEQAVDALTRYRSASDDLTSLIIAPSVVAGIVTPDAITEQRSDGSSGSESSEQPSNESDVNQSADEQGPVSVPADASNEPASSSGGSYLDVISDLGLE